MEVVLADGELMRTGMGAMPENRSWHVYKRGLGPTVDQLFMQSNYGIVTKMGVWLMPYPEVYMPLWLKVWRDDDLGPLMDAFEKIQGAEVTGTKHAPEDIPNHEHPAERIQGGVPSLDWNNMTGWYGGEHGGHIGFSPIAPSTGADAMALRDLLRGYIEDAGLDYIVGIWPAAMRPDRSSEA